MRAKEIVGVALLLVSFALAQQNHNRGNNATTAAPGARGGGNSAAVNAENVRRDPFRQNEVHLTTPGYGHFCRHCYNGYGYGGVYVPYGYETTTTGSTATDQVLANGGTFNSSANSDNSSSEERRSAYSSVRVSTAPDSTPTHNGVTSAADAQPAILVLKDGSRVDVANYVITGGYVIALSPERQKIPFANLDVNATKQANSEAGFEFKIPAAYLPR